MEAEIFVSEEFKDEVRSEENEIIYKKEGYVQGEVGAIIALITGVGVATLVLIFVGTLGGQTYGMVEEDINALNDSIVQGYVKDAITNSFKALSQTGKYMPIVVLAVIISIVLTLVMGLGGRTGGYYGGAL